MNTVKRLLFILFVFSAAHCTRAQSGAATGDTLLTGVWHGTSICQVKNSPCRDEVVVCHISKGDGRNVFNFLMSKIVDGAEEEMGTIAFHFDPANNRLQSVGANGVWTFQVTAGKMEGTLLYRGDLYRVVQMERK